MSGIEESVAGAVSAETAMAPPMRSERARFVRFVVTGGIAAGVNVASRLLLSHALNYEITVAVAYVFGMTTAFVLARLYVFEVEKTGIRGQYVRFALVNLVAFAQVWLVSVGLARFLFPAIGWTWLSETIAHIVGVVSPVASSYIGHKKFSFKAIR